MIQVELTRDNLTGSQLTVNRDAFAGMLRWRHVI